MSYEILSGNNIDSLPVRDVYYLVWGISKKNIKIRSFSNI
jgi:hypothetical protein